MLEDNAQCFARNSINDHCMIAHTVICAHPSILSPVCTCIHAHAFVADKALRCLPVARESQCSLQTS